MVREAVVTPIDLGESYIPRIRELTKSLDFSKISSSTSPNIVEMDVESGKCTYYGLLKVDNIAIANCMAESNTRFRLHTHKEKEYLLLYEGEMLLTIEGKNYTLKPGDVYYVLPEVEHTKYFKRPSKFIAITIPASQSFPDCISW